MLRKEKENIIQDLAKDMSRSAIIITTDYRGVPAKEMVLLRQKVSLRISDYHSASVGQYNPLPIEASNPFHNGLNV